MSVTIPYTELHGSPQEYWTPDGFTATRQLKVVWALRNHLAVQLLAGLGELYEPMAYAPIPARAFRVGIQPILAEQRGVSTVALYEYAQLTVEYAYPEKMSSEFISESWEPTLDYLTLDFEDFCWEGDDSKGDIAKKLKEEEAPGRAQRGGMYVFIRHRMYSLPSEMESLIGSVNKDTIVAPTLGKVFPPETLLYSPPVLGRAIDVSTTGGLGTGSILVAKAWRGTFPFSYKHSGWNKFWRQDAVKADESRGDWAHMFHKEDLDNPYLNHPLADFTPLGVTVAV